LSPRQVAESGVHSTKYVSRRFRTADIITTMAVMQAGVSKAAEVGRKKIASPSQSSRVRIRFSPRVDQKQKSRKSGAGSKSTPSERIATPPHRHPLVPLR